MNILIIGGTRFMGPFIVKKLQSAGHNLTLFHRGNTPSKLSESVEEILGDRNQLSDFAEQLRALKADIVLDMMCGNEGQAQQLMEVFTGFTSRVVVASSEDVYRSFGRVNRTEDGEVDPSIITEKSPLRESLSLQQT